MRAASKTDQVEFSIVECHPSANSVIGWYWRLAGIAPESKDESPGRAWLSARDYVTWSQLSQPVTATS